MKGLPPGSGRSFLFSYWVCGYYITCGGRAQGVWGYYHNHLEREGSLARAWAGFGLGMGEAPGGVQGLLGAVLARRAAGGKG